MRPSRESMLAAIRENPIPDEPRLIYADWLEENYEPEYAEFVRLQCEVARAETAVARLPPIVRPTSVHLVPHLDERDATNFDYRFTAEASRTHHVEIQLPDPQANYPPELDLVLPDGAFAHVLVGTKPDRHGNALAMVLSYCRDPRPERERLESLHWRESHLFSTHVDQIAATLPGETLGVEESVHCWRTLTNRHRTKYVFRRGLPAKVQDLWIDDGLAWPGTRETVACHIFDSLTPISETTRVIWYAGGGAAVLRRVTFSVHKPGEKNCPIQIWLSFGESDRMRALILANVSPYQGYCWEAAPGEEIVFRPGGALGIHVRPGGADETCLGLSVTLVFDRWV